MSRWIKVMLFRAAPKWYLGSILQGLRTQNPPKLIRAPLLAMNTTQIHPDTPRTPPRHLPAISSEHKILTEDNRHQQTLSDIIKKHLSASKGVWGCLLAFVVVWWHLGFPGDVWECLGVPWECLEDVCGYLAQIPTDILGGNYGNLRRSDFSGVYLGSHSLQYGAKTLFWSSPERHDFCSSDYTETWKYQNVCI